jgi:DNA polymerase-2
MNEHTGWLLDLYPHPERGVILWLLGDDGHRRRFVQDFPATFYAAGPSHLLRELWVFLMHQPLELVLSREERRDLFEGKKTVLAARLDQPLALPSLYRKAVDYFPDLAFYDVDLDVALRHAAVYGTFPLARCYFAADERSMVHELQVLDSKWELDPQPPPLRILTIEPDVDPFHRDPRQILVHTPKMDMALDINEASSLGLLNYRLREFDPDLIVSSYGDTFLLPMLLERAAKEDRPLLLNRDLEDKIVRKKARSYFAYNQVVHRGQQVRLTGRLHLDTRNTVLYSEYGLDGALEMARVTSLPIQTAARVSPGTGISSLQIIKALELGILVPVHKEQLEDPKTTTQLFREDMGGAVYDPIIGVHPDVAEVDFSSMYPMIMNTFNVSPETVNSVKPTAELAPDLGMIVDRDRPGLIPQTLAPLLEKRLTLKAKLLTLSKIDCRYGAYKAAAAAEKWMLITCFGYLNFKGARFGKVEAHEAVTAYSREAMMRAKEAAEDLGFRVLHMYVDGMWISQPGYRTAQDFAPLLDEISARTKLPIGLEGIYKWVAFQSSRQNKKIAVPNRYFGIFQDGEIKTRGIETRRRDTPAFIAEIQMEILEILNRAPSADHLIDCLPGIKTLIQQRQADLRAGRVPLENLIVHHRLSRTLKEYRVPTSAAVAMKQLEDAGKVLQPGQSVRFLYALGKTRARAWDLPEEPDPRTVDLRRYRRLLDRAVNAILEPVTGVENALTAILLSQMSFL